jgi:predicted GNAT family acetyltransferase
MDEIRDNTAKHRFELDVHGKMAVSNYTLAPGVITFTHTETPLELRGLGIASRLIRGALESARARGLKVVARCRFVSAYIAKHPEFIDLLL